VGVSPLGLEPFWKHQATMAVRVENWLTPKPAIQQPAVCVCVCAPILGVMMAIFFFFGTRD